MVTCPAGKQSISWLPNTWPVDGMGFEARFARKDCTPCSLRSRCTRAKNEPRIIGLQARQHYEALQSARQDQTTKEFQRRYAARSGIEGTHAQAISRCGLRRCRYIGLAKTRLQHMITAAAVNLVRIADWYGGVPAAATRCSRFAALHVAVWSRRRIRHQCQRSRHQGPSRSNAAESGCRRSCRDRFLFSRQTFAPQKGIRHGWSVS